MPQPRRWPIDKPHAANRMPQAAANFRSHAAGRKLQPGAGSLKPVMQPVACSLPLRTGQSTLEYAVFVAVVASALAAMSLYVRRSIQANLKQLEDQVNAGALPP